MATTRHNPMPRLFIAALLPLVLTGCYEDPVFSTHTPGDYQGKSDSTAIMHPDAEQRAALLERFRAVQTDR